jgi:hypothetical protein
VTGPDGSGKTAFCDGLVAEVLKGTNVRRFHHRFEVLPVRGGATVDPTQPHAQSAYPRGLSEAKVLYVFADFLAASMLIASRFVRQGGCLVIERGWWDLAVDPTRYRIRPHPRLVRALGMLLPRSDLLIVLEAPVDVLTSRKDEISAEELTRQMRAWHEVVPARQRRLYIDASLPLEEVLSLASAELGRLGPLLNLRSM